MILPTLQFFHHMLTAFAQIPPRLDDIYQLNQQVMNTFFLQDFTGLRLFFSGTKKDTCRELAALRRRGRFIAGALRNTYAI